MKKILSSLLVLTLALGCGAPCFAYRGDFTHKTHCLKGILKEGLNILNCASSKAKNKMDELKYRQINGLFSDGLACFDEFNAKKECDLKKLIKKVLAVSHPDNFKAENKAIYDEYYKPFYYYLMVNVDNRLKYDDCEGILKGGLNILNYASSKAKNKMDELKYRQINGLFSDGLACFDEFNAKKEYDLKKLIKKVLAVSHPDNFKAENKTIYDEYYKQIYHLMANADDCLRRGDCDSYPSFTC